MEDHPSLVNRPPIMRQMLERTNLIYKRRGQEPMYIPESWSAEDQRYFRADRWTDDAKRLFAEGEWDAARECLKRADAACRVSPQGRPEWSGGRFEDAEDFRATTVNDLRALRRQGIKTTQLELARFWYQNDANPTAEVDSLVTEIKRYCQRSYSWKILVAEARQG
jgi:hypothetical protein